MAFLLFSQAVSEGVSSSSPQTEYIEKYYRTAVKERIRTGVPASITLAQGILESGSGRSELAVKANNHFGIKCHDWKGQRMYFDDDRKGECFRKYRNAEESFKDHSDFLRYRDRYKFLFDFEITDYKSWAYGLKKAGYATDPAYPGKLIQLIEEYDLARFDKKAWKDEKRAERRKRKDNAVTVEEKSEAPVPETPRQLETPKPLTVKQGREFSVSLSRQLYSQNGVPFVYSVEGETYSSIAKYYGLFHKEILKYNDLEQDEQLLPGTVVYLQPKKARAARHVDKYIVEGGESLRDISQRYAVKMKNLMKLNGVGPDVVLKEGDTVLLRRKWEK